MEQLLQAITDLFDWLLNNLWITILGSITLIQVSPIKLDPWTWIGKLFRSFFTKDLDKRLNEIRNDIEAIKGTIADDKVENARWNILDFANSCRQGRRHTKEEWDHCIQSIYWYTDYCLAHNINNGVLTECEDYLKDTYRKILEKDDFL